MDVMFFFGILLLVFSFNFANEIDILELSHFTFNWGWMWTSHHFLSFWRDPKKNEINKKNE